MSQDIVLVLVIFASILWLIKKHYDNAWDFEQLDIKLKNLKYKAKGFDKYYWEIKSEIDKINLELIENLPDKKGIDFQIKEIHSHLDEQRQGLINVDGKYRIKMQAYEENKWKRPEDYRISEDIDLKEGVAFDPMKNRTSAEKAAYDKLAKQISGEL